MGARVLEWFERARIDIKNQGDGNDIKVTMMEREDGNKCRPNYIWKPDWFSTGGAGYVIETSQQNLVIELECMGTGTLLLRLMGIDRRIASGDRLPLWVDYTSLVVNEKVIFEEKKPQWHDDSYSFTCKVRDGEKIKVEISWEFHGYKGDEIARLIGLCI